MGSIPKRKRPINFNVGRVACCILGTLTRADDRASILVSRDGEPVRLEEENIWSINSNANEKKTNQQTFENRRRNLDECVDDPSYRSPIGLSCQAVKGFNCSNFAAIGFSEVELYHLINSCPVSCNIPCGTWTLPPSASPSSSPTVSQGPTSTPSTVPSSSPSSLPSSSPSTNPSSSPSSTPSDQPTTVPSSSPSEEPTEQPTVSPSSSPSMEPSSSPTTTPSSFPSSTPTSIPSAQPSDKPSNNPSSAPSASPSSTPTNNPSANPSSSPSSSPSSAPSSNLDLISFLADSIRRDLERILERIDELENRSKLAVLQGQENEENDGS